MKQELRQRVNTTTSDEVKTSEKLSSSSSKKDLISLQPDFAIKILYKYNAETKEVDNESVATLKILLKILQLNGFIVNVRPDKNTNFLILFVTMQDKPFQSLVELNNETDKLFEVASNASTDEKISIAERLRLIYLKLTLPKQKGGCGIEIGKNNVKDILPVRHILNMDKEFKSNTKNLGKIFKTKVRDSNTYFLRENFGSKYALYYQFVQNYVSSVGCIAIAGILAYLFLGNYSKIYAFINLFLGLLCYLRIYAAEKKISNYWNLININKADTIKLDETELIPSWKVLLRKIFFIPVTIFGAMGLFSAQFACFLLEIFINEIYEGPYKSILALVPTILVCTIVPVATMVYGIVAQKYMSFEKNPTAISENESLLIKMFIFNCLAVYSPLLITSFIYLPVGYAVDPYLETIKNVVSDLSSTYSYFPNIPTLQSAYKVNNLRISSQIFYFMVISQIVGTLVEFFVPVVLQKVLTLPKVAKLLGTPESTKEVELAKIDTTNEHEFLQLVRESFDKPAVNVDDDYRQHVLQFGFLMLFGPIWTLGALFSFIFGLIQQEGDYVKYIKVAKPVVPARRESSQPWVLFMRFILIIGSFVSTAITLMYNNSSGAKEEIISFVGRSSVENNWLLIVGGAAISAITMQSLLWCFERVIDNLYDLDKDTEFSKEIKAQNLLVSFSRREEGQPVSNVDSILNEASQIQASF